MHATSVCPLLSPDRPFRNFIPQAQEIGEFYGAQQRRAMDFEGPELRKGRSGYFPTH